MQLQRLMSIIVAALFVPASVWASEDHLQLQDRISLDRSFSMEMTPELMGVRAESGIKQTVNFPTICVMSIGFDITGSAVRGGTPKKLIIGKLATQELIDLSRIAPSDITTEGSTLKINPPDQHPRGITASGLAVTDGGLNAILRSYYGAMVFGGEGNWSIILRGFHEDVKDTAFQGSIVTNGPIILLGQTPGDPTLSAIALRQLVRKCSGR